MGYKRSERVSSLLLKELAEMVRVDLKNPGIGFVTLTAVDLTEDLRHAKVFVVARGTEEEKETTLKGLNDAVPYLRRDLGRKLDLRFVPTLTFCFDGSFENADRIHRLLNRIHDEEEES